MPIVVNTPPHSSNLTLLATLKTELLITGTDSDDFLTALIVQASDAICAALGRRIDRMEVTETVAGTGDYLMALSNSPIAKIVSAKLDGVDQTLDGISVYEERAGLSYREAGWNDTRPSSRPWSGNKLWSLRYWGGWLLPGDDISSALISVDASDDSYNDSASLFPETLVAGDWLLAGGFEDAANSGFKQIVSATKSKIVVDAALTMHAASGLVKMLTVRSLPNDIERACLDMIKVGWSARDRDPSISSKRIGDVAVSYFDAAMRESNSPVRKMLGPYMSAVV